MTKKGQVTGPHKKAPTQSVAPALKRTPWIRLRRSIGVAPWGVRRQALRGGQYKMRQRMVPGTAHSWSSATWLAVLSTSMTT